MRWRRIGWLGQVAVLFVLAACWDPGTGAGQGRRERERRAPRFEYAAAFAELDRTPPDELRQLAAAQRHEQAQLERQLKGESQSAAEQKSNAAFATPPDPSACYKDGANLNLSAVRLDFANTGFKWPQPGGLGTPITITYSYSNLVDGQMHGLTAAQLKQGVEEALAVWAAAAPLNFVEVADSGPVPTKSDTNYAAAARPQIRFGQHTIDGASGATLAHTYLPYSQDEGLAGDVHFDRDEDWSGAGGGFFLETALHEIGHALGLDHEVVVQAIMNPVIANRFVGLTDAFLLDDDKAGIHAIYGQGAAGSVTPLTTDNGGDTGGGGTDNGDTGGDETPDETANAVTATIDGETGALVIAGDALDNKLLIGSWCWGTAVVGRDGTTVNGKEWDFFSLYNGDIQCELGGGNDEVRTFGLRANSLDCDLGEGDDELLLVWSSITTLTAEGGTNADGSTEADSITRFVTRIGSELVSGFETDVTRWWQRWFWWGGGRGTRGLRGR